MTLTYPMATSESLSWYPADGRLKRYQFDDNQQRRILREAVRQPGVLRQITPHVFDEPQQFIAICHECPDWRLRVILGHHSIDVTQPCILEAEAQINGSRSPFDLLKEVD